MMDIHAEGLTGEIQPLQDCDPPSLEAVGFEERPASVRDGELDAETLCQAAANGFQDYPDVSHAIERLRGFEPA